MFEKPTLKLSGLWNFVIFTFLYAASSTRNARELLDSIIPLSFININFNLTPETKFDICLTVHHCDN